MSHEFLDYIEDILEEISKIDILIQDITYAQFRESRHLTNLGRLSVSQSLPFLQRSKLPNGRFPPQHTVKNLNAKAQRRERKKVR